jgi:heme oxygenase
MVVRLNDACARVEPDVVLDRLFDDDLHGPHYLIFLIRSYGFEGPLESAAALTPGLPELLELRSRVKAGHLANDLLALGLRPADIAELDLCRAIPAAFADVAHAMGWLYVVERSTLAFSVIRRHLETRLPRELARASSYLSCYDGGVGRRWHEFGAALDELAATSEIADGMIAAAIEATCRHRDWFEQALTMHARAAG